MISFLLSLKPGHLSAMIIGAITVIGVSIILIRFHKRLKGKK